MEKLNWLDKVKEEADRITRKRIRDYQEENSITESPKKVVEAEEINEEPITEEVEEVSEVKEEVKKPKAKARKAK